MRVETRESRTKSKKLLIALINPLENGYSNWLNKAKIIKE